MQIAGIPIVKPVTAYDSPTGEIFIIVLAQSLYLDDHIDGSLLCPNQLRYNGIEVDDIPHPLAPEPELTTHSIYIPLEDVRTPLMLRGVISLFYSRYPTVDDEIENCQWLLFTSELEWDPHSTAFEGNECAISDNVSLSMPLKDRSIGNIISYPNYTETTDQSTDVSLALNGDALLAMLQGSNALTVKHV